FLCDKDFDEYIGALRDDVWYTPGYSIESFLATPSYISYFIEKHGAATLSTREREEAVAAFTEIFFRLVGDLRCYSAFMCEIRSCGEHPQFDDFGIEKIFDLQQQPPRRRRQLLARAVAALKVTSEVGRSVVLRRAREFKLSNDERWLRGNLEVQVASKSFVLMAKKVPSDVKRKLPKSLKIDTDALSSARQFTGDIESLRAYCEARI